MDDIKNNILICLKEGMTYMQIQSKHGYSPKTISKYKTILEAEGHEFSSKKNKNKAKSINLPLIEYTWHR